MGKMGRGQKFLLRKSRFKYKGMGKNIKLGRGEGDGNFGEENQELKKWGLGRTTSCNELDAF